MQVTIVLSLLHANIGRYFYFLVTKGNLTLLFSQASKFNCADESSPLVPTRCLLALVSNGNLILLFFYMGVNSIMALKLSAIVSRILKKIKRLSFLDGFLVSAIAVYLYLISI